MLIIFRLLFSCLIAKNRETTHGLSPYMLNYLLFFNIFFICKSAFLKILALKAQPITYASFICQVLQQSKSYSLSEFNSNTKLTCTLRYLLLLFLVLGDICKWEGLYKHKVQLKRCLFPRDAIDKFSFLPC